MADGTRIRQAIRIACRTSGSNPLERDRFVTDAFSVGETRLGADQIDLRIVGPEGAEHSARFLPDAAFSHVAARRLSKADGTAMVLMADAGAFPPGSYRLSATFRGDISGSDPDTQVLSESGETGDEVVDLRFTL